MKLLQEESELDEIVKLVGMDALSANDRLTLEVARSIREDYLQQNAFEDVDSYTPLEKQDKMMKLILYFYEKASEALDKGANIDDIATLAVRERIGRAKTVDSADFESVFNDIVKDVDKELGEAVVKASQI
jgi:V/A-type H+-transporting ATPase subunit A